MLIRIRTVTPLSGHRLRLELSDESTVERDIGALLQGPLFAEIASDAVVFATVRAVDGALHWPNGAELCPDAVLWGGLPPAQLVGVGPDGMAA